MSPKADLEKAATPVLSSFDEEETSESLLKDLQSQLQKLKLEKEELQEKFASNDQLEKLQQLESENEELRAKLEKQGEQLTKQQKENESKKNGLNFELEEVKVIINLQEEMKAMKELMESQRLQIHKLSLRQPKSAISLLTQQEKRAAGAAASSNANSKAEDSESTEKVEPSSHEEEDVLVGDHDAGAARVEYWKERFRKLQERYSDLENDRAVGQWELRNRITEDSLKYNRRLIHWKLETQKLEAKLQQTIQEQEQYTTELRKQLQASAASVLQHTLRDLSTSQKRVNQLEEELAKLKEKQAPEKEPVSATSRRLPILQYYKDKNML